jgi:hypothetical protein
MKEKLKSLAGSERVFVAVLLCVIGIVSFVLGRYSVVEPASVPPSVENRAGVVFIDTPDPVVQPDATRVVASKNGTKYHLLTCSGAKTINEDNKIYFDSINQAKAAGYGPAANCGGLR